MGRAQQQGSFSDAQRDFLWERDVLSELLNRRCRAKTLRRNHWSPPKTLVAGFKGFLTSTETHTGLSTKQAALPASFVNYFKKFKKVSSSLRNKLNHLKATPIIP